MKRNATLDVLGIHSNSLTSEHLEICSSEHISLVVIDKWLKENIEPSIVKSHIEEKHNHIKGCESCKQLLIKACNDFIDRQFAAFLTEVDFNSEDDW